MNDDGIVFSVFHRKRTISEVQLMHNVQEYKQVGERQDWLQDNFLVGTMSNIFLISFLKIIYFFISVLLFPFYLFFALH
uniref:Uncharacterized protein n=1 Tax=Anabas testudineus TaxID=64144 RepID=A0A3Q1HM35_ANATE